MTCSDVQRVLPEILDGAATVALPTDFDAHLKSCPDCSDLVSDLALITSEARQLAATEEPAPRLWLRIAAELRAEGLIRESDSPPIRPMLVPTSPRRRWNAWWLAPVAAGLLAAGGYVVSHQPASPIAQQQIPATPVASPTQAPTSTAGAEIPTTPSTPVSTPAPQQVAGESAPSVNPVRPEVEPAPNAEDQQFLSVVSTRAPSMRAAYENQLQAVNTDIRETQAYVDRNPGDADARQHLMDAYEQKALLYQIALDRIQ
jgi:hypothetical protein